MPVIIEAMLVSLGMLFVFALAFLGMFLFALTMFPIERGLSKMIWDATAPKKKGTASSKKRISRFQS